MQIYHFIVNVNSMRGQALYVWQELEKILIDRQVSYVAHITEHVGHGMEIAKSLTQTGEEVYLVVCGGDGTVNEVINGICDLSKVTFGYIPMGSANDFGRGLGIKGKPAELLVKLLDSQEEDYIDMGETLWKGGFRRFVISSGIGVDAAVCRSVETTNLKTVLNKLHLGGLTYGILTVSDLFKSPFVGGVATLADGRKLALSNIIFSAAMNFSCEGGGVPMAPKADARDGKLSVCLVHDIPKWVCLFAFVLLLAGKHEKIKGFQVIDTKELHLALEKPLVVHADGEVCGDFNEVTFRIVEHAIRMPVL